MRSYGILTRILGSIRLVWNSSPKWTLIGFILVLFQSLLPVALLYQIKLIVDRLATKTGSSLQENITIGGESFTPQLLILALTMFLILASRSMAALVKERQAFDVAEKMQRSIQEKSLEADLAYFENPAFSDTLHRAAQEAPYRPTQIVNAVAQVILGIFSLAALAAVALFYVDGWLIGVIALLAFPVFAVRIHSARKLFAWQKRQTETHRRSDYYHWLLTAGSFAKEIRLFELGSYFEAKARKIHRKLHHEKQQIATRRAFGEVIAQTGGVIAMVAVISWFISRIGSASMSIGDLVLLFQAFHRAQGLSHDLVSGLSNIYESQLFLNRYNELMSMTPILTSAKEPLSVPAVVQKRIRFENVSFTYPGKTEKALDGISFSISPTQSIALVGENGAGKSTLIKLLCRLYDPCDGKITLDGIDLRSFSKREWWRAVSVLFQDYNHFFEPVSDNIQYGDMRLQSDPARIVQAAASAGAHEMINTLPRGYEQMLGRGFDGGVELSLGQWQSIALARTFYRDAPIVVLDEPSSSLDAKAERDMLHRFRDLTAGKMTVLISHRLSSAKQVDQIFYLEHGKIIETGSHQELIKINGPYSKLYAMQARSYV